MPEPATEATLQPMHYSVLDPDNNANTKPCPEGSVRCLMCGKIIRGRRTHRVYIATVYTEPMNRNPQEMLFPVAWEFDDEDNYDEANWYYVGSDCAKRVPTGYLDSVLPEIAIGQEVRVKDALSVKSQYRGLHGVVLKEAPTGGDIVTENFRGRPPDWD